jgi:hypothetical protein
MDASCSCMRASQLADPMIVSRCCTILAGSWTSIACLLWETMYLHQVQAWVHNLEKNPLSITAAFCLNQCAIMSRLGWIMLGLLSLPVSLPINYLSMYAIGFQLLLQLRLQNNAAPFFARGQNYKCGSRPFLLPVKPASRPLHCLCKCRLCSGCPLALSELKWK